jgi:hypothetical protein
VNHLATRLNILQSQMVRAQHPSFGLLSSQRTMVDAWRAELRNIELALYAETLTARHQSSKLNPTSDEPATPPANR